MCSRSVSSDVLSVDRLVTPSYLSCDPRAEIFVLQLLVNFKLSHRLHREPSLCRCVWKPAFVACVCFLSQCLAVVPVTERVTCISHLVPRYVLPADYFSSPPLPPLVFFSPLGPCFLLLCLCLFTFTVDGNHRLQKDVARNKTVLSFSSPFFPPLKCRRSGMLRVSKLESVLGVPGEQPCHNSRVEWAGERIGGKMNCMLWGFPNPKSLQGLCGLHCAEFTRIYPSLQTIQHVMNGKG